MEYIVKASAGSSATVAPLGQIALRTVPGGAPMQTIVAKKLSVNDKGHTITMRWAYVNEDGTVGFTRPQTIANC